MKLNVLKTQPKILEDNEVVLKSMLKRHNNGAFLGGRAN